MILRRNSHDRFSTVAREWDGEAVVLIGGGPSLTAEQVAMVALEHEAGNVRCIVVNDAYLLAPWADVCYFADARWWKWHTDGVDKPLLGLTAEQVREKFAAFAGEKCSIQNAGRNITDDAVHILRNKHFPENGDGLSVDPGALVTGRHGGFQAINLAVLAGAKNIILLGYDGKPAADGTAHFHGDHPKPSPVSAYPMYLKSFAPAVKPLENLGVSVVNCSPDSAIADFPKMPLEDALACEFA
jgi:hypothetical protein